MANFKAQFHEQSELDADFSKSLIVHGERGESAYEIAVRNGFEGTETEWLESLKAGYVDMSKFQINGVPIDQNRTFEELGEETITNTEIKEIIDKMYAEVFG